MAFSTTDWINIAGLGANAIGGLLSGKAEGEMNAAQIQAAIRQAAAQLGLNEAQFTEKLRSEGARLGLEAAQQTPNRVAWRQQQAMRAAMMPLVRNASVSSPIPGMGKFVPTISGGVRIPEGGFGPETLKYFGDEAMARGEYDLDRAAAVASGGRGPMTSFSDVYGEEIGGAHERGMGELNQQIRTDEEARAQKRQQALAAALGLNPDGSVGQQGGPAPKGYEYDKKTGELKKKGGGFWGGFKKVLGVAAPIALSFIPGVGPLAGAAIGAGTGALAGGKKGAAAGAVSGALGGLQGGIPRGRSTTPPVGTPPIANPAISRNTRKVTF